MKQSGHVSASAARACIIHRVAKRSIKDLRERAINELLGEKGDDN